MAKYSSSGIFITDSRNDLTDERDAFDFDVDEAPTAQTMFMANLSSTYLVYDEVGPSYDSNILSEVHDHDHYQEIVCEHNKVHEMHDEYVKKNVEPVVRSSVSSIQNDPYMMILNDMHEQPAQHVSITTHNIVVDNSLSAKRATSKEQVELYERQANFKLTEREQNIDEQLRIVITNRHIMEEILKKELHSVKMQLSFEPAQHVSITTQNIAVDNSLSAECVTSKEQVELKILPFDAWVSIGKINFVLDLYKRQKNLILHIFIHILQNTNFFKAFTASALLGYTEVIHFMSRKAVNNLYQLCREILSMINQCLTDKKSRNDRPRYPLLHMLWGRIHNIDQRSASLFHLTEEAFILGNLNFIPTGEIDEVFGMPILDELISNNIRNAPYYNAYLKMVAKHDQKVSSKPAPAPKSKETKERPSKASTNKPPKLKPAKEKSTKTTQPQKAGKGKITKLRKVKSPFKLVDEPDKEPAQCEPKLEHQGEGDEDDMELSIQMIVASEKPNNRGDTELMQMDEEKGNDMDEQVNLKENTDEIDQGQAGSDLGRTLESRPPPKQVVMDKAVGLLLEHPEPTHDEFTTDLRRDGQDHFPPTPNLDLSKRRRHDTNASGSSQPQALQSSAWKKSDTRDDTLSFSKKQSRPHAEQPVEDLPMPKTANISDSKDIDSAH
uniref:E-beta-farnesene synthase n=1 Tax=Tanacetum cinerariifolium TaxID=118510 RepID=A0A699GP49_TANCI|nr:hypothetical protein [Tanacetum cinerariifolium]